MKNQFDVWRYDFGPNKGGEHPAVLISHPDICARAKVVNVLFCTSQRQSRPPYPHEVMLNGADGMDWETFCDCSILYAVESAKLFGRRGRVTLERRRNLRIKIRDVFRLNATD
ncbi:MAG: type II toxin-antitoxin system PemK/MazF family toxin [Verrucomicrobiae bacterium]|nr:type II toxin-antitoxin system PemK/MazF family toxin [Verrucomicrobiae bacterium]